MTKKRQSYGSQFKAKVAMEAVKGLKPINRMASEYGVNPNLIGKWKKELLSRSKEIFERGSRPAAQDQDAREARLYEQVGRLQVELEWLKKKAALFD